MMETNKPPSAVPDVITARVGVVPDANMRTADRMFNVAGKQANRGATGDDQGSNYGQGAVAVETQTNTPDHCMNTQDRKFKIADTADGALRSARATEASDPCTVAPCWRHHCHHRHHRRRHPASWRRQPLQCQ